MTDTERRDNSERTGTRTRPAPFVRSFVVASLVLYYLQLTVFAPTDVEATLGFSVGALGSHWWSAVTFPLVNAHFWPMVVNLAILGLLGSYLERHWGSAEFSRYFAICTIGAWATAVTLGPAEAVVEGVASATLGSIVAFSAIAGNTGLFRVGALVLSSGSLAILGTMVVLATGIAASAADPAPAAYLVHAAGLVAGWAYLRAITSVNLNRLREGVSPLPDEPDDMPPRAIPRHPLRDQRTADDDVVARSNAAVAREAAVRDATARPAPDPALLNRVLDKISAHGLESLTQDERELLNDLSRRLRDS